MGGHSALLRPEGAILLLCNSEFLLQHGLLCLHGAPRRCLCNSLFCLSGRNGSLCSEHLVLLERPPLGLLDQVFELMPHHQKLHGLLPALLKFPAQLVEGLLLLRMPSLQIIRLLFNDRATRTKLGHLMPQPQGPGLLLLLLLGLPLLQLLGLAHHVLSLLLLTVFRVAHCLRPLLRLGLDLFRDLPCLHDLLPKVAVTPKLFLCHGLQLKRRVGGSRLGGSQLGLSPLHPRIEDALQLQGPPLDVELSRPPVRLPLLLLLRDDLLVLQEVPLEPLQPLHGRLLDLPLPPLLPQGPVVRLVEPSLLIPLASRALHA
mmetsp:Transcript_38974/g.125227  ORF Transcript_38974/g.125227 Transcript_38974/m.125227 type:complete len:316 (+) Transcript_38974:936-1883(+)